VVAYARRDAGLLRGVDDFTKSECGAYLDADSSSAGQIPRFDTSGKAQVFLTCIRKMPG
jgi:hypothetical protein